MTLLEDILSFLEGATQELSAERARNAEELASRCRSRLGELTAWQRSTLVLFAQAYDVGQSPTGGYEGFMGVRGIEVENFLRDLAAQGYLDDSGLGIDSFSAALTPMGRRWCKLHHGI